MPQSFLPVFGSKQIEALSSWQVIPFEQAVAKIRVAVEAH